MYSNYDENDTLLHEYRNLKTNAGDNLKDDLNQIDLFYAKLNDNYSVIKIELVLSILDNINKSVSCELYNSLRSNFLCIKHYNKVNSLSVNNNLADFENNISLNLEKIDNNKNDIKNNDTDIAYNLKEINLIKNAISKLKSDKIYLKNLDNLIFRGYNYIISYNQVRETN